MNKTPKLDYVSNALEHFSKILSLHECLEKISKDKAAKFAKSFNTRARNGPQLIKDLGIIPYLTFLASKSEEDLVRKVYNILKASEVRCEDLKPEKAGYAAYFNVIVMYLEKLGIIEISNEMSVLQVMQILLDNLGNYRVIEPILMNYLAELKKLSNAYFKEVE